MTLVAASGEADAGFTATELLGRPTDTSVAVNAVADQDIEVYFEYGTESGVYSAATTPTAFAAGTPIEQAIEGLLPDTQYYYRMRHRSPGAETFDQRDENTFHTQRATGETFTFAVQADPHLDSNTDPELYQRTLANIAADDPDFLIDLGDTFMSEKFATNYGETVERHLLARSYYDLVSHSTPLYLVLGNHEGEEGWYLDGTADNHAIWGARARTLYFPNPLPDGFYTGNGYAAPYVGPLENYFAWEWGEALFVVLDPYWYTTTNPNRSGDGWDWTLGFEQYSWLKQVLETSSARFKFVFAHQLVGGFAGIGRGGIEAAPYYEWGGRNADGSRGFETERTGWAMPIHDLLVQNGVAAFFHGHDHLYVKQDLDGIVYQEVPQPGNLRGSTSSATSYGYVNGVLLGSSGHLRITVSPRAATVDYVRSFRNADEDSSHVNRSVEYSYTLVRDSDGDGSTDDVDPCTTFSTSSPPTRPADQAPAGFRMQIGGLDDSTGSQRIKASGTFNPARGVPAIDPSVHGVHLRLADMTGELYDVSIPGGLVGSSPCGASDGWMKRSSASTTTWRYRNRSGGLPDGAGGCAAGAARGMTRIAVQDATAARAEGIRFKFMATDTAISPPIVPLHRVQFDFSLGSRSESLVASTQEATGQCAEMTLMGAPIPNSAPAPYCKVSPAIGRMRAIRCVAP